MPKNNKQTLVILPGWGGSKQTWQQFADLASAEFDVQIIELPCFGEEPCPKDVWGVEEYTQFVKEKLPTEKPVILLGHSFGGQVAAHLAATEPQRIDQLILSGAAILRPKKSFKRAFFYPVAKCGKLLFSLPGLNKLAPLAKKVLYKAADSPDYNKTNGIERQIFQKITREDGRAKLPNIQAQTVVIHGTNDTYVPLSHGKIIAHNIPNATLHIIEGGKHGLHLQQPDILYSILKENLT